MRGYGAQERLDVDIDIGARRRVGLTHAVAGDDFALTAGWGRHGAGDAVMPGQGRIVERPFTADERAALSDALPALGDATFDVHLNGRAFWANVPAAVWSYRLGGYQVLKKWLSYRERPVLGRPLHPDEVQHFPCGEDASGGVHAWIC